jgi:serine/threonine protein kinase
MFKTLDTIVLLHNPGYIHIDIKIENILIKLDKQTSTFTRNNKTFNIKDDKFRIKKIELIDYGKTRKFIDNKEIDGTIGYIDPLAPPLTFKSDIFSLGVTLFTVFLGINPLLSSNSLDTSLQLSPSKEETPNEYIIKKTSHDTQDNR